METIKLFTFITISLIPTIVSSIKCKNREWQCKELCCTKTQYYDYLSKKCKALPESDRIWWEGRLHDDVVAGEVVEFEGCKLSDYLFGFSQSCYTLLYNMELKKFRKTCFLDVPCDRLRKIPIAKIVAALYVGTLSISLSIMLIYTVKKGLEEKFIFKLFSWYLVSMAFFLVAQIAIWQFSLEFIGAPVFVFTSTWLWLNVIAFQMWSNEQDNSQNNQGRFICYSIYVWGISAIITSVDYNNKYTEHTWYLMPGGIIYFNLVAFLVLSVNMCITRCRADNQTTENPFCLRLPSLILRLGFLMGVPRTLLNIFDYCVTDDRIIWAVFFTVEPFVLFVVLLWNPKNSSNCNLICCFRRKSEQIPNEPEVVDIHIN